MAAVGIVLVAYSAIALLATLTLRAARDRRRAATVVTLVLAVMLTARYTGQTREHAHAWTRAAGDSERLLVRLERALPNPPPGSTIYTFGHSGALARGYWTFAFSWDLAGAVKLLYDEPTLTAYPILMPASMRCGRNRVEPRRSGWLPSHGAAYGKALFVDIGAARAMRIESRRRCLRSVTDFQPGSLLAASGAQSVIGR